MKKLLSLLYMLTMVVTIASGQQPFIELTGHVINQQNGAPMPGQIMYISIDSLNYPGYYNQVSTDETGFYTDTIPFPGTSQGMITVYTADCNGTMASATAGFYPGVQQIVLDFSICGNPPQGCVAAFRYELGSNDMLNFAFFDESYTIPGSAIENWFWDFGDGTNSTEQNPIHSFAESGIYNACLYISSSDSSCSSSFCMPVEAGFIMPDSCSNYFSYYPDPTGNAFTFEGWTMNGPADTYFWDFGDGTSGNGQTVTHSFASPDIIYNVCLTTTGPGPDNNPCTAVSCQAVSTYIPSPCESSFWYYPDSSGTGFTFEGWAMNNQVESWTWDFGDGTTGSGQTVTHIYADPNMVYTACLTTTGTGPDGVSCSYVSCQEVIIYVPSPCENYFEAYSNDGNTYSFAGYLLSGEPAQFLWNFGDGTAANGQQVTHTFQPNGQVYNVCLTTIAMNPANDSCVATSCQVIVPGGGSSCEAIMSATPDSSGYTYFFQNLSQGDHSFMFWDFGDGGQSTEANPVHTYAAPGIYLACLSIGDSLNNCWDQTCQEIWVDIIQPGCMASFIAFPADSLPSSLSYMFINTSAPGFTSQQWSFGDGTGSSDPNPVHTYAVPGTYTACLTIWDTIGICQSTYCMAIFAGEEGGDHTISGIVLAGNYLAVQGIVWLIGANNNYTAETSIDSAGIYSFGGVPAGSYYIYAMLTPDSPQFFNYLPTYYQSSLTWQGATIVPTGEPNGWHAINLLPEVSWSTGPAAITGSVNWGGTFKSGGTPAANVEIILFNSSGLPIAYTFSDSEGNFIFSNLPYGEYTLQAEMVGMTTQAAVVILSDDATTVNISFIANGTSISTLGIDPGNQPELMAGNPYPNPVGNSLNLDINISGSASAVAEILDLQGRIVKSEKVSLGNGTNRLSIETADLTKGMYILRFTPEGRKPLQRKFVK